AISTNGRRRRDGIAAVVLPVRSHSQGHEVLGGLGAVDLLADARAIGERHGGATGQGGHRHEDHRYDAHHLITALAVSRPMMPVTLPPPAIAARIASASAGQPAT